MKLLQSIMVSAALLVAGTTLISTGYAQTPATPVQVSPANGATNLPQQVTVFWFISNPGESYRVQIATDPSFATIVTDRGGITDLTGWTVFGLAKNRTHYWRVNATRRGRTSPWSPTWSFTTTNAAIPGVPTLVSPAHGAVDVPLNTATFSWNAVPGATAYDFMVAPEPSFGAAHIQWYGYTGTSIVPTGLEEPCILRLYWRVRAKNPSGSSAWSEVRSFTLNTLIAPFGRFASGEQPSGTAYGISESLLSQNYPNPFRNTTAIEFISQETGEATLKAYDVMGREVERMFDGTIEAGVRQQVVFNGDGHPEGTYIYKLVLPGRHVITKKMLLKK
jgi:hypothetical protein